MVGRGGRRSRDHGRDLDDGSGRKNHEEATSAGAVVEAVPRSSGARHVARITRRVAHSFGHPAPR